MDIQRQIRRSRAQVIFRRYVLPGVALLALVVGIGTLPVGFVYFYGKSFDRQGSQSATRNKIPEAVRASWLEATKNNPVAFVDVTVVPMDTNRVLARQTVIVRGGRIAEIGPVDSVKVPADAKRINASGKFLMPGLADLHIHLQQSDEPQDNLVLLRLFVANGVTTVLSLRGNAAHLELRQEIRDGEIFAPRLYTAGPFINEPFVTTPEQVEQAVIAQKRAGYDFLKMHGDLSREAYARLNRVARREGMRVVGHAPRNLGIEAMFEERPHAVAHAEEYIYDRNNSSRNFAELEPRIPELAQATAKANIWLIPNLTAFDNIGRQIDNLDSILNRPEMRFMPRNIAESWGPETNPYTRRFKKELAPGIRARYHFLEKLVRAMRDAGVRIVTGTDALNTGVVPGFSIHDELRCLVAAGLTPYEALRAATANAADFLGATSEFGTVTVGLRADLILVEANPLADVGNASKRAGVMLGGRWFTEAELGKVLLDRDR